MDFLNDPTHAPDASWITNYGGTIMVDYAIAQTNAGIYPVGLYASPSGYEGLHEMVFLPVVDALAPSE